jgi:ppGpp synthetase/RelA/SpoT-type nucleotidyltranferase
MQQDIKEQEQHVLLTYLENHMEERDDDQSKINTMPEKQVRELLTLRDEDRDFQKLMLYYECAMQEVMTKVQILNKELMLNNRRSRIEMIKSRLKKPRSIFEKMERLGIEFTVENIEDSLSDIAGVRVICSFVDDLYKLRDCLLAQDDVKLIQEKDYIRRPKKNGYRSLHLIIEVPVYLTHEKKNVRVEVQLRTIAMDFWASLEHNLRYKQDVIGADAISRELQMSAEMVNQLDQRMVQIRERIDTTQSMLAGGTDDYWS